MALGNIFTYHLSECADDLARLFEGKAGLGGNLVNQFVLADHDRLGAVSRLCLRCWHDFLLARWSIVSADRSIALAAQECQHRCAIRDICAIVWKHVSDTAMAWRAFRFSRPSLLNQTGQALPRHRDQALCVPLRDVSMLHDEGDPCLAQCCSYVRISADLMWRRKLLVGLH